MKNFILILCLFINLFIIINLKNNYNKQQEILNVRTKQFFAQEELLHSIWQNDSIYWNNVVIPTNEYKIIDSLRQGDWEDFYYKWD